MKYICPVYSFGSPYDCVFVFIDGYVSSEVLFANGHFKVSALISSLEMALAIGATLIDIQTRSIV